MERELLSLFMVRGRAELGGGRAFLGHFQLPIFLSSAHHHLWVRQ